MSRAPAAASKRLAAVSPDPQHSEPTPAPVSAGTIQRVYAGSQVLEHDVYRLAATNLTRNVSYSEAPILEDVPHVHFFHTIDSDGRKQVHSTPAGGHFHVMEITQVPGGAPHVVCASGPVQLVRKKVRGAWVKAVEPVDKGEFDTHTHDVQYIKSEKIQLRSVNAGAVAVVAADAQRGAPIPGLDSGN